MAYLEVAEDDARSRALETKESKINRLVAKLKPKLRKRFRPMLKTLKRCSPGKHVRNFLFTKAESYVISRRKDSVDFDVLGGMDPMEDVVKSHKRWGKTSHVLVYAGDHIYVKISTKSYLKLLGIHSVAIHFRFQCCDDGSDEYLTLMDQTEYIYDISELMGYVNRHQQGIYGVYDVQSSCAGYTDYRVRIDMLVRKKDGNVEFYKDDINDFMKAYDLFLF